MRETGTRGLLAAVVGSIKRSETDYAAPLVPLLNDTTLLLADRDFGGDDILTRVAATGAQRVVRLTSRRRPAGWATLPDGSVLTRTNGYRFRIIDIQIIATCADGSRVGDRYRIITTLLDHRTDPGRPYLPRALGDRIGLLRVAPHLVSRPRSSFGRPCRP